MSRPQTCRDCSRDFVGPDTHVGENLCSSCLLENHDTQITDIMVILKNLIDTSEALLKRIEKLERKNG